MTEILLSIVAIAILGCWVYDRRRSEKLMTDLLAEWKKERQQLLDRIQAPSFGEMKNAEVKKIRAENGEKPPQPIIQM